MAHPALQHIVLGCGSEGPKWPPNLQYLVESGVRATSLTSEFSKRPLSFSLQDKHCVEASGEGPAQQEEGPKVEMESWQKECDSLRKVTEGTLAVTGRLRGKRRLCIGKEP